MEAEQTVKELAEKFLNKPNMSMFGLFLTINKSEDEKTLVIQMKITSWPCKKQKDVFAYYLSIEEIEADVEIYNIRCERSPEYKFLATGNNGWYKKSKAKVLDFFAKIEVAE